METIWKLKEHDETKVASLMNETGLTRVTTIVLLNRGLTCKKDIDDFLNPSLDNIHDPLIMKDMKKAVTHIKKAMKSNKNIWVFGDFDVDGITSTTILMKAFLEKLNYPINYYIPNRLFEGYGLKNFGIDKLHEQGCELIITVDNGITAVEEVEYARSLGIEVIITDHHTPKSIIPNAIAVINPHQIDCNYPNKNLAGCGVAFKLACALIPNLITHDDILEYLNLVAFGSIADIVSITGENRIFTHFGTQYMGETNLIGLKTLISMSDIKDSKITAGQIGFNLAPKINATGRIGEPKLGVELFLTKNVMIAHEISTKLIKLNLERQEIEKKIVEEALFEIENNKHYEDENILIIAKEGWHTGILGIATSKICEKYNKPTILLSIGDDGACKGSARSISEFNMFESILQSNDLMIGFGGHPMACGMSFSLDNLSTFKCNMNSIASSLTNTDLSRKIYVECELLKGDISKKLIRELDNLEPFGVGNATPKFLSTGLTVKNKKIIGKNKNHAKFTMMRDDKTIDVLGFNTTADNTNNGDIVSIIATLSVNDFMGKSTIQMLMSDIK